MFSHLDTGVLADDVEIEWKPGGEILRKRDLVAARQCFVSWRVNEEGARKLAHDLDDEATGFQPQGGSSKMRCGDLS
jgi:hypothetical protein